MQSQRFHCGNANVINIFVYIYRCYDGSRYNNRRNHRSKNFKIKFHAFSPFCVIQKHISVEREKRSRQAQHHIVTTKVTTINSSKNNAKPIIFNILQGGSISFKENLSMVLGMVLYTASNFLLQKFFVFKRLIKNARLIR